MWPDHSSPTFYCHETRLIAEIDGASHAHRQLYDSTRTQMINRDGLRVIRFMNEDVFDFIDEVLEEVLLQCENQLKP